MQTTKPQAAKTLVQDVFEVKEKDPDGKKFDKGQLKRSVPTSLGSMLPYTFKPECDLDRNIVNAAAVSRIICHSDLYEYVMTLDVNTDIYPVEVS